MSMKNAATLSVLMLMSLLVGQDAMANPVLFSENNLSGTSTVLAETSEYGDGSAPPIEDFIHFSPPDSYDLIADIFGETLIIGDNGTIRNRSLYVPQCWTAFLRVIPKYQFNLQPREYISSIASYFPLIQFGRPAGAYEFGEATAEVPFVNGPADVYIGYATKRDPSCIPTHDPLIVSRARYEFFSCYGPSGDGIISWTPVRGNVTYTLQRYSGTRWYSLYSGFNREFRFAARSGSHRMRVRASADGIDGPWKTFNTRVPRCPGTLPY